MFAKFLQFTCILRTDYYNILGPWYFGELLTGVYGSVSVHGVSVGGHFIPGSMTYGHGSLQVSFILHTCSIFILTSSWF
jgi:hypothetical protein